MTTGQKGQAWYVLRGYRYQLLLSLNAWLGLRSDEILFLEVEEDFSVESATDAVATQVKSSAAAAGPKPHSLRSKDVRAALARFWTRSDQGKDPRPQLAFIAQGGVAREHGLVFPENLPGIEYWRAALLGAGTAPIRAALASVFDGEPIGEWINRDPSDEELLARLLSRVRWMPDAQAEGPLIELIRDRIAELCLEKGLWVTFADEAVHSLFNRVFEAAIQPEANDRRLTVVDLHRSIEIAATPFLALQNAARSAGGPAAAAEGVEGLLISALGPRASAVAERRETVSTVLEQTRGEPLIWLHGTHGVGKSILARLIALQIAGSWLEIDLRPVQDDPKATLTAWRELLRVLHRTPVVNGILIDDLTGAAFDALRGRLAAFIASSAPQGMRVIISSPHEPSVARLTELGASPRAAVRAPYFTEAEIYGLVTAQAAPPIDTVEGWTRLLLLTTNGGHPLLVAAKIASLRSRSWPISALTEDVGSFASEAVRATREEARRRLLNEIPSAEARQLLRRLGNVYDRADDALMLKLAHLDPPISNAGDALAILRGAWIEVVPGNDLRLSPLINDIGNDLGEREVGECWQTAAEHWLSFGALDQRTLPLCFWNALRGKHTSILMHICQAIETLPPELLRGTAALLSPMALLSTDRSIFPEVPPIGAMLRLLQVEVANALENDETAARAAKALMAEIEMIDHDELRLLSGSISIPKVLLAEHVNINPTVQLDWALRLRVVLREIVGMNTPALSSATQWLHTAFPPVVDLPGFLFAVIVNRIRSSSRMLSMIEALDALNESDRNSFLDAAKFSLRTGGGFFVHGGWAQEQLDNVDLRPALERFEHMSEITRHWTRMDIRAELANARSVILDEGLNDQPAALAVIDNAIRELGNVPALVRQKAKVLGHSGDELTAARLLMSVEDVIGVDSPIDRARALREGAVSSARAELFEDALRLFGKAREVLTTEGEHPGLAVGMQVEIALVYWSKDDRPSAILALADALDAVERLDPADSRQNERAHQFARAAIGLFWNKLDPYPSSSARQIAIGQASALSGDEALLGIDLKPLSYNWRILALCEIELGVDSGVERRSTAKQAGPAMASVEMFIAMARYAHALSNGGDPEATFRMGLLAISAYATTKGLRESKLGTGHSFPSSGQALQEYLLQEGLSDLLKIILVDLLIWQRFRRTWNAEFVARIEAACKASWGDAAPIADVISAAASGAALGTPSTTVALAANLSAMPDLRGNPRARFDRDLLLVSHTAYSLARRILEPLVVQIIADGWSTVLNSEGFALRSPTQHLPAIEAAIGDMQSLGLKAAARLLLDAAPAVRAPLSGAWEQLLHQISGNGSSGPVTATRSP
jgi:hypothetical protein